MGLGCGLGLEFLRLSHESNVQTSLEINALGMNFLLFNLVWMQKDLEVVLPLYCVGVERGAVPPLGCTGVDEEDSETLIPGSR